MRYSRVMIESIGYALAPNVITSAALEERLAPVYDALKLPSGQIAALTGVRERRFWDAGQRMADGASCNSRTTPVPTVPNPIMPIPMASLTWLTRRTGSAIRVAAGR